MITKFVLFNAIFFMSLTPAPYTPDHTLVDACTL